MSFVEVSMTRVSDYTVIKQGDAMKSEGVINAEVINDMSRGQVELRTALLVS